MIFTKIDLYSEMHLPRKDAVQGFLEAYRHTQLSERGIRKRRPALLVIPGGGYGMLSEREAEPVALQFFAEGFDCFVLRYDVAPLHYPTPLLQAGMAMLWLRKNASALAIDDAHIAAAGFSAGGHLAGCLAFLWRDAALQAAFGRDTDAIRPDACLLAYPVVTADERYRHNDSFDNFCGKTADFSAYSLERHVPRGAPPCFLWTTNTDDLVPPENTLLLYGALRAAGIPTELHVFEYGPHGLSVSGAETEPNDADAPFYARVRQWLPLSLSFLKTHGFCIKQLD